MLAVPHRQDDRRIARDALDGIRRLQHEAGRLPDQTKVFGRRESNHFAVPQAIRQSL